MDTSYKQQDNSTPISTFETIDMALYTWLNETLDIHTTTNDGIKKVPVSWFSRERAFQIKNDRDARDDSDEDGFLEFPKIQLKRASMALTSKSESPIPGIFLKSGDYKNNQFGFWRKVKQEKTKNFANARSQRLFNQPNFRFNNPEVVYDWVFTPYPSYYDITYEVDMRAIYMQQLNEMMAPLQRIIVPYNAGVFMLHYNGFRYEAFVDKNMNMTTNSPDIGDAEKIYEAKFTVKVLGFTNTSDATQNTPNIVYRDTPVKVRINRERTIFGDINNIGDPDTPFRE
jgi:hypothetical protein